MNTEKKALIYSLFAKEPQDRLKERLYDEGTGNSIRLSNYKIDQNFIILDSYILEIGKEYRPKISICTSNGLGYYFIEEPVLDKEDRKIFSIILGYMISILNNRNVEKLECIDALESKILDVSDQIKVKVDDRKAKLFAEIIVRETFGYGLIEPLMADDNLTDISCASYQQPVFVKHREYSEYNWMNTNITFTEDELDSTLQKISSRYGKGVNILAPTLEIVTKEGHRMMLTYKTEVSLPSSTFTIRKFPTQPWTIAKIIINNTIDEEITAYLWQLLESRQFVILSGAMGSGKTTLLSSLLQLTNPSSKILTIEDTAEVSIGNRPNWQRLITRKAGYNSTQDIGLTELSMLSLRTSSDYIALGEVRGSEIQALVQAAGTGLGCITTFHAGSLEELVSRMRGKPLSVEESFLQTIKCIVFLSNVKLENGKYVKRITSIEEPLFGDSNISSIKIVKRKSEIEEHVGLDEIYDRSRLLKQIHNKKTNTLNELCKKRDFLKSIIGLGIKTFEQLHPLLIEFYGGKNGT